MVESLNITRPAAPLSLSCSYPGVDPQAPRIRHAHPDAAVVRELAHSNICSLIRLRGERMQAPANAQVDVIVHGTNARSESWARADSSFSRQLRRQRAAVTASFQWSGARTERDRRQAGHQLAMFLDDVRVALKDTSAYFARELAALDHDEPGHAGEPAEQAQVDQARRAMLTALRDFVASSAPLPAVSGRNINVIAHSHGGNVLGHALAQRELEIGIAVLLAVPALASESNSNLSWTAEGANRVVHAIVNASSRRDFVQTTLAKWNERISGRAVRAERHFHLPASATKQANWLVEHPSRPAGAGRRDLSDYLSLAKDELLLRINAHSAMHSDGIASDISQLLRRIAAATDPLPMPGWLRVDGNNDRQ